LPFSRSPKKVNIAGVGFSAVIRFRRPHPNWDGERKVDAEKSYLPGPKKLTKNTD
jgi:hypothetical protein